MPQLIVCNTTHAMKLCTTVIFWKYFILINVLNILHVSQPCVPMSARMEETALFPIHASAQTAGQETHACKVIVKPMHTEWQSCHYSYVCYLQNSITHPI